MPVTVSWAMMSSLCGMGRSGPGGAEVAREGGPDIRGVPVDADLQTVPRTDDDEKEEGVDQPDDAEHDADRASPGRRSVASYGRAGSTS